MIPANVQGEKAAGEIAAGIGLAEKWNAQHPTAPLDVLIVGRGGGSIEDLWPFNEEMVARAIYQCSIPIISAVGHEIDVTIADFVADLRAPTPSAAAELCVPLKEELKNRIQTQTQRLLIPFKRTLEHTRLHLSHLSSRLIDPRERIRLLRDQFQRAEEKLSQVILMRLTLLKNRLQGQIQMLHSLSPLQILARGFSLTSTDKGNLLRSVSSVRVGEKITTRLTDGELVSEVISK